MASLMRRFEARLFDARLAVRPAVGNEGLLVGAFGSRQSLNRLDLVVRDDYFNAVGSGTDLDESGVGTDAFAFHYRVFNEREADVGLARGLGQLRCRF